jgi:hypothetical protein
MLVVMKNKKAVSKVKRSITENLQQVTWKNISVNKKPGN